MNESLPGSVYLHVPFCVHRCGYCDFTLVAGRDDLMDAYLDSLALEFERFFEQQNLAEPPHRLKTLFWGGGTPTHLTAELLQKLVELMQKYFCFEDACEFSVEANPAELGDEKLDVLKEAGVNRISLGVQSFDAKVLNQLERDHTPEELDDVIGRVKQRFENVSFDLIFGVPGQSIDCWNENTPASH